MSIDKVDREILRNLFANSRLSFRQLADRTGVAPTTVIKRVKRMERSGVIRGYTLDVDAEKLGFPLTVLVELKLDKKKLLEAERRIGRSPSIFSVYDITGESDSVVMARFRDRASLDEFVKSLLAMDFVEGTNTRLVLNVLKENAAPPV
jgi:DNA-binding Lrp family transcriptional regulator